MINLSEKQNEQLENSFKDWYLVQPKDQKSTKNSRDGYELALRAWKAAYFKAVYKTLTVKQKSTSKKERIILRKYLL